MNNEIYVTRSSMPPYEEYIEAIKPLWESHWLTNMGKYHQELEKKLAAYLDVPEVSLIVNGHMALELAIQSFDFPEGGEVITTPFTFISTTHAIIRNHLQPVFCDVKESDGTIDETRIEALITPKTVAILPVHVYGNVCNVEEIERIASKYGLKVIYDAAHTFGERYKGKGIGNRGDISIFSFHATKVYNTIEGGAVICRTHDIYKKLNDLRDFGIRDEELVASVGANGKMNEFSAVMGICNLKYIDDAIENRKHVYKMYHEILSDVRGVRPLTTDDNSDLTRNYSYFPIVIEDNFYCDRDEIYSKYVTNGIYARKYFYPLTADQACFKNQYRNVDIQIARDIAKRVLVLPIYDGLKEIQVERIINILSQ